MHIFSSAGVSIAYIDLSPENTEAPPKGPVVLVHGFASNHAVNWVFTQWTTTLTKAGYRVIALDNRGHGQSEKLYDPAAYAPIMMAEDVRRLLDHLEVAQAAIVGYSMGARVTAQLTVSHPERVLAAVFGGLGIHLIEGAGLPPRIAEAMEAASIDELELPDQRMFRAFAEATKSDLHALAACIRGSRASISRADVQAIQVPVLVAVGSKDSVAGPGEALAQLMPHGEFLDIPGRDHNLAVGDKVHKQGVLAFLERHLEQRTF